MFLILLDITESEILNYLIVTSFIDLKFLTQIQYDTPKAHNELTELKL